MEKQPINISTSDTLFVKFRYSDYYANSFDNNKEFFLTQDESNKDIIYSNKVNLHFMKTDQPTAYVQVERVAEGRTLTEAKRRAEKIQYMYKIEGNRLILDNYLLTDTAHKYRNQEVDVYLYLPQNQIIKTHESISGHDVYSDDYTVPQGYNDRVYKTQGSEFICLNCTDGEPYDDNEIRITNDSTSTTV